MQQVMEAIDALLDRLSHKPVALGSLEWHLQNSLNDYKRALQNEIGEREIEDAEQPTVWMP